MRSSNPSIGLHDALYTLFIDPTPENADAAQISGLSIINTHQYRHQGVNNFDAQNVRESIEDASKDVHLSLDEEISQEVSHMFGLISLASSKDKNRKEEDKDDVDSFFHHPNSVHAHSSAQGSRNVQHDYNVSIKSDESRVENESGLSLSMNDASTVQATARMPQQ